MRHSFVPTNSKEESTLEARQNRSHLPTLLRKADRRVGNDVNFGDKMIPFHLHFIFRDESL